MCDAENDIRNLDSDDAMKYRIRQLEKQCASLAAEVDKMRPVVEAAVLWANTNYRNEEADAMLNALSDACDEYQASKSK